MPTIEMGLVANDRRGPPAKTMKWVEHFDLTPQIGHHGVASDEGASYCSSHHLLISPADFVDYRWAAAVVIGAH